MHTPHTQRGITLVEVLVSVSIFLVISLAVYQSFTVVYRLITLNKIKVAALDLAEERIEVIKNMPYATIGLISGLPVGTIPHFAQFSRSGVTFDATTTIRSVDDPFDGTIGGTPNDTSPADYKQVEMEIGCSLCKDFQPFTVTAITAPKSLETTSGNGALFIHVIDANGQPIEDAQITIVGLSTSTVSLTDSTNNAGLFQLVDVPPGNFLYRVKAEKSGYSSSTTFAIGDPTNPNPSLQDATVLAGTVTQITFTLDQLSTINIRSVTSTCGAVASFPFTIKGSKKIGTAPDVYKVNRTYTTNASGIKNISNIDWDTYSITPSAGYAFGGTLPQLPIPVLPGATQDVYILATTSNPNSLLLTVKDSVTGLPIDDATVELDRSGFDETVVTNRGFFNQTDWQGGSGQTSFGSMDAFSSTDGFVDYSTTTGQVVLQNVFGTYAPAGNLTSSWFDVGASTTLYSLLPLPASQVASTGPMSVRFQLESTNAIGSSTTGMIGPDGTTATFYTATSTNINAVHSNKRFMRYELYLSTIDTSVTPIVSDISITFGTQCIPNGQAYFSGLDNGDTYNITVTKTGYQTYTGTVDSTSASQLLDIPLVSL